jgi:hypothetical protein
MRNQYHELGSLLISANDWRNVDRVKAEAFATADRVSKRVRNGLIIGAVVTALSTTALVGGALKTARSRGNV